MSDALHHGLAALGLELAPEQVQQLHDYAALLTKWNQVYNLTALRAQETILTHHLLDCLALVPALRAWADVAGLRQPRMLDVGSGAGLPGLVIAICQPDWAVETVDTVGKKAAFMQQAAATLGLAGVRVHHARVEQLKGSYALITSRAFAALEDFVRLTQHLLAADGRWLAMKAKATPEELRALPPGVTLVEETRLQVPGLDAERRLLWLQKGDF